MTCSKFSTSYTRHRCSTNPFEATCWILKKPKGILSHVSMGARCGSAQSLKRNEAWRLLEAAQNLTWPNIWPSFHASGSHSSLRTPPLRSLLLLSRRIIQFDLILPWSTHPLLLFQELPFKNPFLDLLFLTHGMLEKEEGKTPTQALVCVMRRLVNIIYGMMKHKTAFRLPEQTEKQASWLVGSLVI